MTIEEYFSQWEGYTADEIANILRWKGIKGCRMNKCFCPIAIDLRRETQVIGCVVLEKRTEKPNGERVRHSEELEKFIRLFDANTYPDLKDTRPLNTDIK